MNEDVHVSKYLGQDEKRLECLKIAASTFRDSVWTADDVIGYAEQLLKYVNEGKPYVS